MEKARLIAFSQLGEVQKLPFSHLQRSFLYLSNPALASAWAMGDWDAVITGRIEREVCKHPETWSTRRSLWTTSFSDPLGLTELLQAPAPPTLVLGSDRKNKGYVSPKQTGKI